MSKYEIREDYREAVSLGESFAEKSFEMEILDMEELFRERTTGDTGVFGVDVEKIKGDVFFMPDWCIMRNFAQECSFHETVQDAHRHFQKNAIRNLEAIKQYAPRRSDLDKWTKRFINKLSKDLCAGKITDEATWNKYISMVE